MIKMRLFLICLVLLLLSGLLFADVPVRSEELIYSIMAFNGRDYAGTFAKQDADTIYLIADVDNFLSIRKTMVYFWPITGEWRTDTDSLNVSFEGTLKLSGREIEPVVLGPTRYTYYNKRGEYEYNWIVAKDAEADKAYEEFQAIVNDYYARAEDYQQAKALYDYMMEQLTNQIMKLRDEGEDVTLLIEELKKAEPPPEPQYPDDYIAPPVQIREAFIVNLPVGEYDISFENEDGTIMEGSDRKLVVFEKRRAEGIGYEVIPGDKWTRPSESTKSSSVLYLDGSTDLFLRPFFQQEYNDLYYEKMLRNDTRGNPSLMKWVRIQQVPRATLQAKKPGSEPEDVTEKPYVVEQIQGAALGYKIVPYDPEGAHVNKEPSLVAFRIFLDPEATALNIHTLDNEGNILDGSRRQVRIIKAEGPKAVLIIIVFLPLIFMGIVRMRRNRQYSS
jgi:hypothetical protein